MNKWLWLTLFSVTVIGAALWYRSGSKTEETSAPASGQPAPVAPGTEPEAAQPSNESSSGPLSGDITPRREQAPSPPPAANTSPPGQVPPDNNQYNPPPYQPPTEMPYSPPPDVPQYVPPPEQQGFEGNPDPPPPPPTYSDPVNPPENFNEEFGNNPPPPPPPPPPLDEEF